LLVLPGSSAAAFEKVRLQQRAGARAESPVGQVMEEARAAAAVARAGSAFGHVVSLADLEGIPTVPQGMNPKDFVAFLAALTPAAAPLPAGFPASFPEEEVGMETEVEVEGRERRSTEGSSGLGKRGLYQGINLQFYEVFLSFFDL